MQQFLGFPILTKTLLSVSKHFNALIPSHIAKFSGPTALDSSAVSIVLSMGDSMTSYFIGIPFIIKPSKMEVASQHCEIVPNRIKDIHLIPG